MEKDWMSKMLEKMEKCDNCESVEQSANKIVTIPCEKHKAQIKGIERLVEM